MACDNMIYVILSYNVLNPKSEILNSKQYQMTKIQNLKRYDLEERSLNFAKQGFRICGWLVNILESGGTDGE
jgi:hypothetical protein